jgi:hypothetical protein
MTTPKNNKGGAKEVTTTQNNKVVSNTTNSAVKATTTPKSEEKAVESKPTPTPPVTAPKVVEMPKKPKTIEEQLKHFEGLEKLIKSRRILAQHLGKINYLEIDDDALEFIENEQNDWIGLKLIDRAGRIYEIEAPALVRELHQDLIKRVENKLGLYDQKILAYTQN